MKDVKVVDVEIMVWFYYVVVNVIGESIKMTLEITNEERVMLQTLLQQCRSTTVNNRKQCTNPNKDIMHLHTLEVIDILLDKLKVK